jgi:hypothetical protein
MLRTLALNSRSSCLCLPSAGIIDIYHHIWQAQLCWRTVGHDKVESTHPAECIHMFIHKRNTHEFLQQYSKLPQTGNNRLSISLSLVGWLNDMWSSHTAEYQQEWINHCSTQQGESRQTYSIYNAYTQEYKIHDFIDWKSRTAKLFYDVRSQDVSHPYGEAIARSGLRGLQGASNGLLTVLEASCTEKRSLWKIIKLHTWGLHFTVCMLCAFFFFKSKPNDMGLPLSRSRPCSLGRCLSCRISDLPITIRTRRRMCPFPCIPLVQVANPWWTIIAAPP